MARKDLAQAKDAKKDEFYTQLDDIAKDLKYYKPYFKDKVVFCNCDDPYESNFFKYFALNFNQLGLRKLIATCYNGSPVSGNGLTSQAAFLQVGLRGIQDWFGLYDGFAHQAGLFRDRLALDRRCAGTDNRAIYGKAPKRHRC